MIDSTCIVVEGGNGGDGCVSFRREKYVPRGGPNGGDGGHGGDVVLVGDVSLNTLLHLRPRKTYRGGRGAHGKGKNQTGGRGAPLEIPVPCGTEIWLVREDGSDQLLADVQATDRVGVVKGGRGGRGNVRFVSPTNQEPRLAEKGEWGERAEIRLEVKLIADMGIIGKPNAGKSTLLASCSRARPKVADYPFTTTDPVLGVVEIHRDQFTVVEIPGLIEGAHLGIGLGTRFLRHAERTRVFIHLLDGLSETPLGDWQATMEELRLHRADMAERPQIVAVTKLDVTEVREKEPKLRGELLGLGCPVFFISAATGEGVPELLGKTLETLRGLPPREAQRDLEEAPVVRPKGAAAEKPRVERDGEIFVVHSARAERLAARVDLEDYRVRVQLLRELTKLGVVKALERAGVKRGDFIRLGEMELEW